MDRLVAYPGGAVAQAIQSAQDYTWAGHIAAGVGVFDGQLRRIIPGGVGTFSNRKFWLEWDATNSVWDPVGGDQPYYVGAVLTDSTLVVQTITLANVAHPVNFWRDGLGLRADILAETSVTTTARTFQLTLGTEDLVNLPTATNRRVAGRWGFVANGASSGWVLTKRDTNEFDFPGQANTNVQALTQAWSGALTLGGSISFTSANGTATLRRYRLHLIKG